MKQHDRGIHFPTEHHQWRDDTELITADCVVIEVWIRYSLRCAWFPLARYPASPSMACWTMELMVIQWILPVASMVTSKPKYLLNCSYQKLMIQLLRNPNPAHRSSKFWSYPKNRTILPVAQFFLFHNFILFSHFCVKTQPVKIWRNCMFIINVYWPVIFWWGPIRVSTRERTQTPTMFWFLFLYQ